MVLELNMTSSEFFRYFWDITAWFNRRPSLGGEGRGSLKPLEPQGNATEPWSMLSYLGA